MWNEALPKTFRQFPIKLKLALDTINLSDKEVFEEGVVQVLGLPK
jgi:hypothetical protein